MTDPAANPEAEAMARAALVAAEDFANGAGRIARSNQRMRDALERLRRNCYRHHRGDDSCSCALIDEALRTDDL